MAAHKTGKLWVVYGMKIDAPWGEWFVGERVDTVRRGKVIWPAELAADRDRFDAIPYGEPTAKQMLEFLHSEDGKEQIKLTRPKGKWWLSRDTVVNAPWDGEWRAGNWISHMRSSRGSWPDEFADVRDRFDAIPYGESTVKQKLDFLYSEDGQKQILSTAPVGQLRFCKATRLDAPWDAEWKAGSWIYLIKAERVEKTPEIKAEWDRIEGLQLRLGEPTVKVKIDFLYTEDAINQVKGLHKTRKWWFYYATKIKAPWNEEWAVGEWISNVKSGNTPWLDEFAADRPRFDALPFAEPSVKIKLDFLESDEGRQKVVCAEGSWRIRASTIIDAPWNGRWRVGTWMSKFQDKWPEEHDAERNRFLALPYKVPRSNR